MNGKSVVKAAMVAVLLGAVGTAVAADRTGNGAVRPTATGGRPAAAPRIPAPVLNDPDFIDAGVLEGVDTLEGGLEIGGLLVDEMLTKFGHDLFDAFNRHWKPPEGASYNIVFGERFDRLQGSFATVKLNDTVIFEGPLSPREDAIADLGKALARDIRNLVRNTANLEEEEFY